MPSHPTLSPSQRDHILRSFPSATLRQDFPILQQSIHDQPLVYLDNAASSQKPLAVINAIRDYYLHDNANVHRGVHSLSQRATDLFELARQKIQHFIHAKHPHEIIWTRGTTESLNLVALSWGRQHLQPGDEILLTQLEHHANIVPWQMLAQHTGASLRYIPYLPQQAQLDLSNLSQLIHPKTRIVSLTHISNVLGIQSPIQQIRKRTREVGAILVIDGAQSAPHTPIDVQQLDCDFFAFSAHKMCGPTGIGVLYGKQHLLEQMPPLFGGGEMIQSVDWHHFTTNTLPHKFEAGTPPIAQAIGFAAAIDYLQQIGMHLIHQHQQALSHEIHARLSQIDGLRLFNPTPPTNATFSFALEGIHPYDLGEFLDQEGIAIRTGHHCAQPLMRLLDTPGTARASFSFYNTTDDIDAFIDAIHTAKAILS